MNYINQYLVLIVLIAGSAVSEDTLLSVVQIFRHGERTPIIFYPTDPYRDPSYWNGLGTGQLTDYGKVQLIELGQFFRERYDGFVSTNYSEQEIYMTTVSGKRNLLSAESFLKGLFPNEEIDIPVHNASIAVIGGIQDCLRYDLEWLDLEINQDPFKQFNEEHSEDYKYITEHSMFPVLELMTGHNIWDTLQIERRFNYTLPEWTESVFPETLTNVSHMYAYSMCYNENLQRLGAGGFINKLIHHFNTVLSGGSSPKIQLFSAHDVNLACLLSTFEAFSNPHFPDFASSLIFELRQGDTGNFVNAYYKPGEEMLPITLRGCTYNCKIEDFRAVLSSSAISELEWLEKCYILL